MQDFFARHKIKAQKIAVAVSGGADSLALVLMAKENLAVFGFEIVALTVDHHLRPNSTREAQYVANVMQTHGIEHHIIEWLDEKPTSGVEESARIARYKLLTDWCRQNNIQILLTAHHLSDQAETFLMRLQRGSGLKGLCCMREISENNGIIIARPLLNTPPETMRNYLLKNQIQWIEDPSNTDTRYLRNRVRTFLPQLEQSVGITPQTMAETATRLQSADEFIETCVAQTIATDVQTFGGNTFCFRYAAFSKWHREIKFRILAHLCQRLYIPRAERILSAIETMSKLPFNGLTLGGKEIFCRDGNIWVVPELKTKHQTDRKAWKNFLETNPLYKNKKIPHKVRIALLKSIESTDDIQ